MVESLLVAKKTVSHQFKYYKALANHAFLGFEEIQNFLSKHKMFHRLRIQHLKVLHFRSVSGAQNKSWNPGILLIPFGINIMF